MSSESKFLLIGLQDAGKTTFLAALWHLVQPGQHPSALVLDHLQGNARYLNIIRKDWLEYKRVPRTELDSERVVSMRLKSQQSEERMTLHFPDLSGESFEHQWTSRQWKRSYQHLLETASGGLLFVNPDSIKVGVRIDQVDMMIDGLEDAEAEGHEGDESSGELLPWDKKQSPTQVQLIEILQFMRDSQLTRVPFRLAIVISAWDRISDLGLAPSAWLAKRLPMLSQFLRTNEATFECECFGVSAQGGAYTCPTRDDESEDAMAEPLSDIDPVKRIKVVGGVTNDENDITFPLKWMMGTA